MKSFITTYKHLFLAALYLPFYLIWFGYLEQKIQTQYYVVTCSLDYMIPFSEWFVFPYFLWFALVPAMFLYLGLTCKQDFYRFILFLYSGMTLYLVICTIFPNGQNLRPSIDFNKNIPTRLMRFLWTVDTSTNVFPSIHAYNSIAVAIAALRNKPLSKHPILKYSIVFICVLICMATVFLKQHSILDVLGAIAMALLFYYIFYGGLEKKVSMAHMQA